jgi:uncharacterized protein (DUF885 family)
MPSLRCTAPLLLITLLAACRATGGTAGDDSSAQVARFSAAYDEQARRDFPEIGTFRGGGEFDDRLTDLSGGARAARLARVQEMLAATEAVNLVALSHEEGVTLLMLQSELRKEIGTDVCQGELWDVNPLGGPQVDLLQLVGIQQIPTPERGAMLLARYRAMPGYIDTHVANLREGLAGGYRAPKIAVERVIGQLDTLLATPDSSFALLDPLRSRPEAWSNSAWTRFTAESRAVVTDSVRPAYRRYRDFLRDSYLPRAREAVGVSANPQGRACYAAQILAQTSLELAPEEIHRTGLREMAKIHAEMREITRRLWNTENLDSVFTMLRENPRYSFDTREKVEEAANAAVWRAQAKLPEAFGRLPQAPLVVKRMEAFQEKDAPAAYYFPPAADGSRPGTYYVNTYEPRFRPRYTAEVLAFHEGVPGHHLQIAIQQELEQLPEFRKYTGTTAFVEGWGLYSERLSDEMGLYSGDVDRLGMLSFEAWRAARLVTDSGMHALGWSRERALEYMLANTALTPLDAGNEIDRYIVWPGQALAYKVGQLEILRLRAAARERLGERFDLRGFHDVVLGSGAVTLPILRRQVEAWVEEQAG